MKAMIRENTLTPKSPVANAIGYMLSRENNFNLYLKNPELRMENNPAERAFRKLVIVRKNWLMSHPAKRLEELLPD